MTADSLTSGDGVYGQIHGLPAVTLDASGKVAVGTDHLPRFDANRDPLLDGTGTPGNFMEAHEAGIGYVNDCGYQLPVDGDVSHPVTTIDVPSEGATVSGTVSVSGMATDNIGVVSTVVQLDDLAGNYWDGSAWVTDPATVLPAVLVGRRLVAGRDRDCQRHIHGYRVVGRCGGQL